MNTLSRRQFLSGSTGCLVAMGTGSALAGYPARIRHFMQTEKEIASTTPYGVNEAAGRWVDAGDVRLYYEVYGKGSPLLVLHGGGVGCAYEMGRFIDSLRQQYRVIIPSTRGHGKSGFGTSPLTYAKKGDDVAAVLKAEEVSKVRVLGFSDGGYSAYSLAVRHPELVERIVAIGAGENRPGLRRVVCDLDAFARLDPAFVAQQQAIMPEPGRWKQWLRGYADFYSDLTVSKETFMAIRCPVLLMAGELDQNAPLDTVLAAYRMIPSASLSIIPAEGHVCFVDHYDAVWTAMRGFLTASAA